MKYELTDYAKKFVEKCQVSGKPARVSCRGRNINLENPSQEDLAHMFGPENFNSAFVQKSGKTETAPKTTTKTQPKEDQVPADKPEAVVKPKKISTKKSEKE